MTNQIVVFLAFLLYAFSYTNAAKMAQEKRVMNRTMQWLVFLFAPVMLLVLFTMPKSEEDKNEDGSLLIVFLLVVIVLSIGLHTLIN